MRTILLTIATIVVLASCNENKPTERKNSPAEIIHVKLLPIQGDTNINVINVSGSLSTEQVANLSFKIGGIIENITVKEGDKVKKGQLLATLKSAEISAQVQQAQLVSDKARRDYDRARNLYADSVMTLEQMQNAKTGLDIAQQGVQQVLFNQQYSKIYAPADGFIVQKRLNAGELASSGTTVVAMNVSSAASKWILKAGLSDADWAAIALGNNAQVTVDAFPSKYFNALVTRKSLSADPVSGSFMIELQVDFKDEQPAVGMFGTASVNPSKPTVGFSIPYDALLEANGRKGFVFVSDDRKTVKKVEVTIAAINNNTVSIIDGLEGHAYIVTSGSPYLNDASLITTL
ncbi:MAG: efflux RND transporter periplasmic adaptor subunit [Chitinophagaceae bacterium]|nr:efflux RND transporter periplasmic adaptor subunit [Chitinophagaceae bacterium]